MPIYEYRCEDCQQLFEEWCKQVEPATVSRKCPICNGTSKRLMSQTSFALKGDGWYVTEYGAKKSDTPQTESTVAPAKAEPPAPAPVAEASPVSKESSPAT